MEIYIDPKTGERLRINRPRINLEEYHYNLGVYNPHSAPVFGLYESNAGPDRLAVKFPTYFKSLPK